MSNLKQIFEQKQALRKQIEELEKKANEIKDLEEKKILAASQQLKKILLDAGISGSVTLWIDNQNLKYIINETERSKSTEIKLDPETRSKIKSAFEAGNRPVKSKKGHYKLNGFELPVSQLVEYALIGGIKEDVGELLKFLPEISVGQASACLRKFKEQKESPKQ